MQVISPATFTSHSVWIEDAIYAEQRIPAFVGNPLIAALPESFDDDELIEALSSEPEFKSDQRQWPTHERMHMLLGLSHFMVPLEAHIRLARVLDSMMRDGYVGRAPFSKQHNEIYQSLYRRRQNGGKLEGVTFKVTPQLSTSLIGLSGMGKTTTVKRFLATIPHVIRHRDLNLLQVPWLHVEMTSDGKSVKAIALSILKALDKIIPDANYFERFNGNGKVGSDSLMVAVGSLLTDHLVGLLVIEEVQNLANSPKGKHVVMAELTTICNVLQVPILFIGTNKAEKVLGSELKNSRRSLSHGLGNWGALPWVNDAGKPGEWVSFMSLLWDFQWVRKPCELTPSMLELFYECTQGVIDLAIKLFVAAQARAMVDGSEEVTEALVAKVYSEDLKLVHPMVEALKNNDLAALAKYEDCSPLGLQDVVDDMQRRYKGSRTSAASIRPGHPDFAKRLAVAGMAIGLGSEQAEQAAAAVENDGTARDLVDATQQMMKKVSPPKPVSKSKTKNTDGTPLAPTLPDLSQRPKDYRNAIALASEHGTTVFEQLVRLGFARSALELIGI